MNMHAIERHHQLVAQTEEHRKELHAEKYATDIIHKINTIDIDSLTLAGPRRRDQVSYAVPGAIFDGTEYKHITISFNLGLQNTEPQIFEGRHPGRTDVALDIGTPRKLTAIEHLLREENSLGARQVRSLKDSSASGEGIEKFSASANVFSPQYKSNRVQTYRINFETQETRADGSELPIDVHCDIQTDNKGNPVKFKLLAYKDGNSLQRRPLAGTLGFNSISRDFEFEPGAKALVKEFLKANFAPKKKLIAS